MSGERSSLEQHLQHWQESYGADLAVPTGRATPRQLAPHAESVPAPEPAAATQRDPAPPSKVQPEPAAAVPAADRAAAPTPTALLNEAESALAELRSDVIPCTRCKLHQGRRTAVFGEGNPRARVLFVGEAPGAKEDQTGRPFVGPAGQLLDRIIEGAMGLRREDVFIANVNKCRPPNNRAPAPDEVAACLPFLKRQVEILQPDVIVCLGRTAAQNLLGSSESTTAMRRRQHEYSNTPVIVTWHPAYLLREPSRKRETWEDIKTVNRLLGLPDVPAAQAKGTAK